MVIIPPKRILSHKARDGLNILPRHLTRMRSHQKCNTPPMRRAQQGLELIRTFPKRMTRPDCTLHGLSKIHYEARVLGDDFVAEDVFQGSGLLAEFLGSIGPEEPDNVGPGVDLGHAFFFWGASSDAFCYAGWLV